MHGGIIDSGDIHALDNERLANARKSFWDFRVLIHPAMLQGWFQYDVAQHLQQFFKDFRAGLRPKMLLSSPPQHGKSDMMVDFIAWMAGQDPTLRVMFASYSDSLGERANSDLQRILDSPTYQACFYYTHLPMVNVINTDQHYKRNSSLLEFVDFGGSFRNTTVNGQITGFGLDLGIIDDPIKGRTTTILKEDLLTAAEELGFPKAMPILDAGRDDRGRGIGLGNSDTKHAWRCPRFRRSSRQ